MYKKLLINPQQFGLQDAGQHQQWWIEFPEATVERPMNAALLGFPSTNAVNYRALGGYVAEPRETDARYTRTAVLIDKAPVRHGTYITRDEREVDRVAL